MNTTGPPSNDDDATWTAHDTPNAPAGDGVRPPRRSRKRKEPPVLYMVTDETPRNEAAHKPFIVPCPACDGTGRVLRDGSQVRLACRLCWERGVVARIVAEQHLQSKRPTPP